MRKINGRGDLPEMTGYTKYYEHDGMLRAYANRAMWLAMIFGSPRNGLFGLSPYTFACNPQQ